MRKNNIIFWIATGFIFLFEGVMPALTSQTEMAKEGIRHLGYPEYFGTLLAVFKVAGSLILVIPQVPSRIKEWAYAGFGFDFIFAFVSHVAVDGFSAMACFPLAVLAILAVSYVYYHKKQAETVLQFTV
jgi:DoxX-like family